MMRYLEAMAFCVLAGLCIGIVAGVAWLCARLIARLAV